jgi:hypothetical protein
MTSELNDVTLVGSYSPGEYVVTLQAGHGFVVGEYLEIYSEWTLAPGGVRKTFEQFPVVAVATNDITLGHYISVLTNSTTIVSSKRVTRNMAVNGSLGSPVVFEFGPPDDITWQITRAILSMKLTSAGDEGKFGNIAALTNGVFFGIVGDLGSAYFQNYRTNSDFRSSAFDLVYPDRSGGTGDYGLATRKTFAGQNKSGVAINLRGNLNERIQLIVQDDLTAITEMTYVLMGHERGTI